MRTPTPRLLGPEAVLDSIVSTLTGLARTADRERLSVAHAGVVVPGIVEDTTGRVVYAANLGFADVPLAEILRVRTGLAVDVGHDVRAGGTAEAALGAARGARHALFVPLGTGIAGSILADGRALAAGGTRARSAISSSTRRPPVRLRRLRPPGGRLLSGPAIAAALTARTGRTVRDAKQVADLVRAGDPDANAVWSRATDALGAVLATLATTLAPELVVIGGGIAEAGDLLLTPLRSSLASRLTFQRTPRITRAELGDRAGCLGAGLLAWQASTAARG